MKKKSLFTKKQLEYIEAIVYILAIIIVTFCKVYGSIYFNFIPLLVILGIVGNILFKRGIVTTVFSYIVSICIVYTKGNMSVLENILYSSFIALDIAMGELLGEYIFKTYKKIKEGKKKKKFFSKKLLKLYIITFVILVLTIFINTYINGNVIDYNICKRNIYEYIEKNYGNKEDIKILNVKYSVGLDSCYIFNILDTKNYDIKVLKIYLKDKNTVIDEYKQINKEKNNNKEKSNLLKYLEENNYKEKYNNLNIGIESERKELTLQVSKTVDVLDDIQKEIFAKQVVELLSDIKGYENYNIISNLQLTIINNNNKNDMSISNVYMEGYNKNMAEGKEEPYVYILKSLSIEYIDSIE